MQTPDEKAQEFAQQLNTMIGIKDACNWCKYSRAWFTILPFEYQAVADRIVDLFSRAAKANVKVGKNAEGDKLQISAYID